MSDEASRSELMLAYLCIAGEAEASIERKVEILEARLYSSEIFTTQRNSFFGDNDKNIVTITGDFVPLEVLIGEIFICCFIFE